MDTVSEIEVVLIHGKSGSMTTNISLSNSVMAINILYRQNFLIRFPLTYKVYLSFTTIIFVMT